MPGRHYLPLALFLCAAGLAGGLPVTVFGAALTVLLAYTLVFQFRLWDDLSDQQFDRVDHPQRVLSQACSIARFYRLEIALFTFNLVLISLRSGSWLRLLIFLLLNGIFLLWYRWRYKLTLGAVAASHMVLIKYPVFVYLLSIQSHEAGHETGNVPLLLSMSLVYFCFGIYEILHDRKLRSVRGAHYVLAAEMVALNAITVLMAIALLPHNGTAVLLQWTLVPVCTAVLVMMFQRHQARSESQGGGYVIFLLGFFGVLTFALGLS